MSRVPQPNEIDPTLRQELDRLTAVVDAVGSSARDGAFGDSDLEDITIDVGSMVRLFHQRIENDWIAGPAEDVDLCEAVLVMKGLDHSLSALSVLLPMFNRRRAEVEAKGVGWDDHIQNVLDLKDTLREIRHARAARRPQAA